jgi:hypothetical protein
VSLTDTLEPSFIIIKCLQHRPHLSGDKQSRLICLRVCEGDPFITLTPDDVKLARGPTQGESSATGNDHIKHCRCHHTQHNKVERRFV